MRIHGPLRLVPTALALRWRRGTQVIRPLLTVAALAVVAMKVVEILTHSGGFDAHAYWVADAGHPYGGLPARLNARWVLPIALFIAQPLTWFIGFALFTAWIGMWRHPLLRKA